MKKIRVLIYDSAERSFVGKSWRIGAKLFAPSFDKVIAAPTVHKAMDALEAMFPLGKPDDVELEVQIWGHGYDGQPLIAGERIKHTDPALSLVDVLWLRSCYVMRGEGGANFSTYLARRGTSVVGHTCIIGTWGMHSGLVGLRASSGALPWWTRNAWPDNSAPWKPRTIPATQLKIPKWAWGPRS